MKNRKTKTLFAIAMIIAMLFAMSPTCVFAEAGGGEGATIQPFTVVGIAKAFTATSTTKATAEVIGTSSGATPFITSKITLQSAPLGKTSFTDVSGVSPSTKTVNNQTSIMHTCTFPITSDKEYRIKIELTDKVNGIEATTTVYHALSR